MTGHDPDLNRYCRCGADCQHPAPFHQPDCPRASGCEVADGTELCNGCRQPLAVGEMYAPRLIGTLPGGTQVTGPVCLPCAVTWRPTLEELVD